MQLTVPELLARFETLHDAIVTDMTFAYRRASHTTVQLRVVARDVTEGDAFKNPVWRDLRFTLTGCEEYRLNQGLYDNVVILQSHFQELDGEYWAVIDASLYDDGVDLTPAECRESTFYFRARAMEIEDLGPGVVE